MSRMVGGTFGVAAVGALFQSLSDSRLESKLDSLSLTAVAEDLVHGQPRLGRRRRAPAAASPDTARQVGDALRDTFVHSLTVSMRLSAVIAALGVVIALVGIERIRPERRDALSPAPVHRGELPRVSA